MKSRAIIAVALASLLFSVIACNRNASQGTERVIKSTTSGDTKISLSSGSGEIREGENELILAFTDASGTPLDIRAASLKFHMPSMGSMAEMNDVATLTTTDSAGRFHARANIEAAGSWEAMITFQGSRGTEQATMNVIAK